MRKFVRTLTVVTPVALAAACASFTESDRTVRIEHDFVAGAGEWQAGIADYLVGTEDAIDLIAEPRPLPAPLDENRGGFYLAGTNQSDDLFMYLVRRVDGLTPGATYRLRYTIELATNAPSGCSGVGGAPGESVVLKAGGSTDEPMLVVDSSDHYRLNVDKGEQTQGGPAATVLGHIGNSSSDCDNSADVPYELKSFDSGTAGVEVNAADDGSLWLLVGTDSGFEARTALYYTRIAVTLEPH